MSIVPASRLSASDLVLLGNNLLPREAVGLSVAYRRGRRGAGVEPGHDPAWPDHAEVGRYRFSAASPPRRPGRPA